MAKGVQLPPDFGPHPELLEDEVVGEFKVSEDIRVVGAGLVRGDHAAMHNLQLAILNKAFHLIFFSLFEA